MTFLNWPFLVGAKRWLNLRKFFTLVDIAQNGRPISHLTTIHLKRKCLSNAEIWHPFLEISAKLKNFLRLSHLWDTKKFGYPIKIFFNVWVAEYLTNPSSVLLLRLVRFSTTQTLFCRFCNEQSLSNKNSCKTNLFEVCS